MVDCPHSSLERSIHVGRHETLVEHRSTLRHFVFSHCDRTLIPVYFPHEFQHLLFRVTSNHDWCTFTVLFKLNSRLVRHIFCSRSFSRRYYSRQLIGVQSNVDLIEEIVVLSEEVLELLNIQWRTFEHEMTSVTKAWLSGTMNDFRVELQWRMSEESDGRFVEDSSIAQRPMIVRNIRRIGDDQIEWLLLQNVGLEEICTDELDATAMVERGIVPSHPKGRRTDIVGVDVPVWEEASQGNRQTSTSSSDLDHRQV